MLLGRGDRGVEFRFIESKQGLRGFFGVEIMFAIHVVRIEYICKQQPFERRHIVIGDGLRNHGRRMIVSHWVSPKSKEPGAGPGFFGLERLCGRWG